MSGFINIRSEAYLTSHSILYAIVTNKSNEFYKVRKGRQNMANRRYIVTFKWGTKYQNKYKRMVGNDKDEVYGNACGIYGFLNVSGVYVENDENLAWWKAKGFTELL